MDPERGMGHRIHAPALYGIGVDGSDARLLVEGSMFAEWRPR
jgi:hypothetical protein